MLASGSMFWCRIQTKVPESSFRMGISLAFAWIDSSQSSNRSLFSCLGKNFDLPLPAAGKIIGVIFHITCVCAGLPLPWARLRLKPSGLTNSKRKTAMAVTISNITNIITQTDALKGSGERRRRRHSMFVKLSPWAEEMSKRRRRCTKKATRLRGREIQKDDGGDTSEILGKEGEGES